MMTAFVSAVGVVLGALCGIAIAIYIAGYYIRHQWRKFVRWFDTQ